MPESESIRIVRTAIDNGINFMDNSWDYTQTAHPYAPRSPPSRRRAGLVADAYARFVRATRREGNAGGPTVKYRRCTHHPDWTNALACPILQRWIGAPDLPS
ncbi:MAG: hypothetical protein ACLQNE_15055, partial [Thermoguttaceae bacterium]